MSITIYNRNIKNDSVNAFHEMMMDAKMHFFASELLSYGFENMRQIDEAIDRAVQICKVAEIPIRYNFKSIYVCKNGSIICDCKLSTLGRKLLIINADSSIPLVAKVQIELLKESKIYAKI